MSGSLAGRRVVVTRARAQAGPLVDLLESEGAEVLVFPCIEIVDPEDTRPVDEAIDVLDSFDWVVFTSANAVERFARRVERTGVFAERLAGRKVAAVGPATAAALERLGVAPDLVPEEHVGEGLADALLAAGVGAGARVLLPRALEAREVLPTVLSAHGAEVVVVPVYRTVPGPGDAAVLERLRAGEADAVTFTSSSTVRTFVELTRGVDLGGVVVACIGPVTAKTASELGLRVDVEPEEYTVPALVAALADYLGPQA